MRRVTWARFFRHRGFNLLKIVAFALFCWWLVIYGFKQDAKSSFGEHLDRNQIERIEAKDFGEEKEIVVDFDEMKNEISEEKSDKLIKEIEIQAQVPFVSTSLKSENIIDEISWQFSKPPNIFNSDTVGELGVPVEMPKDLSPEVKKIFDEGWKTHQFNQYLSDLISVRRQLPDYRGEYCKAMEANYSKNLPATSVIIIFHNEAWTSLLRSVHSVIDRSPPELITEIILVDDFSDLGL